MWKLWTDNEGILVGIAKELSYWLFFSVVLALAQLWLVPFLYYLAQRPTTWVELVGNGSLLFFATTITSKTTGEYFKKAKTHNDLATFLCIAVTLIIVVLSVFAYALVTAGRVGVLTANSLSPERVATLSEVLAVSGLVFSASFTLFIRVNDK